MKVIVLQHAAIETPGKFSGYLKSDGAEVMTIAMDQDQAVPSLDPFDLMIVMGGVQDVWQEDKHPWLVREKEIIRQFVLDMHRPYLGVCLGHQLLAVATGGRVEPAAAGEIGMMSVNRTGGGGNDDLLDGLPTVIEAVQWHGAEVTSLPNSCAVLASSPNCKVQALRVGEHGYGFQWHIEASVETITGWSKQPDYALHLDQKLPGGSKALIEAVAQHEVTLERTSKAVFDNIKLKF